MNGKFSEVNPSLPIKESNQNDARMWLSLMEKNDKIYCMPSNSEGRNNCCCCLKQEKDSS